MRYKSFSEDKLLFFTNTFFYLNFPNVLSYVGSKELTYLFFIALQIVIYLFTLHLFLVALLKKRQKLNILRTKLISFMNLLFQIVSTLFYWVFLVPFLEMFANLMDCDWYSYFPDYERNCPNNNEIITILSVFGMIMVFICGVFILWLYRTYSFLDKSLLKKKFTLILLAIYLCKTFIVCLWPLLKNSTIMVFLFLHAIGLLSIFDYLVNFPITNTFLSKFYISILMNYELLCIIFTLDCYSNIFEERDLFYIIVIVILCGVKLGITIFKKLYYRIVIENFQKFQFLGFSLEEFHRLYHNRFNSNSDLFVFCGMLKFHIRVCKLKDCVLNEKKLMKFDKMNIEDKEKLINKFISEMFLRNIREVFKKNQKNSKNYDSILLKYCSFLANHNNNSIKSYYEIQHMLSLNTKKSFYFQSISLNLLKIIEALIKLYEYESKRNSNENSLNEKEIDLSSFFEILKEKDLFKQQIIEILQLKVEFWEEYKTGIHSYSKIIRNINKLMKIVIDFEKFIEYKLKVYKNSQKRIFALKFKIMFTCFVLNTVNESIKFEDELEKLKKKELTLEKNIINCNSFFYGNVVTMQASFLKSSGTLLESSKNIQLANFFNYSSEEIKALKNIENFMPEIIAKNHSRFINFYMNRARSKKDKEKVYILAYVLNKKGFVFPVKKYTGMSFDAKYNVIMHTALLDLGQRAEKMVLIDSRGNFSGCTESFFSYFCEKNASLTLNHFLLFNIYCFIPELESILKRNAFFEDKSVKNLINQSAAMYIPEDFTDILEVLTVKIKEENESKSHNKSYISVRTEQTKKSSTQSQRSGVNRSSRFMSKFFKTKTILSKTAEDRQKLEKKLLENSDGISNYEVLKELVNPENSQKFLLNFNMICHRYKLNKSEDLCLGLVHINKISKREKKLKNPEENSNNNSNRGSFIQSNFQPPSTYKDSEGIRSGFVQIPPENRTHFALKEENLQNLNENLVLTTENEEAKPLNMKYEYTKKQTLFPPEYEKIPSIPNKNTNNNNKKSILQTSVYQTMGSNLELNEKLDEKDKRKAESQSNFELNTPSSAHKIKMLDVTSHHSSISNIKKTFSIFGIIKFIQQTIPSSTNYFTFSQFIELIIIFAYCLIVFFFNIQYIDKYYNPLENSIYSLSTIYNSFAVSSLVTVRYELQKIGLASSVSDSNEVIYEEIFALIFQNSFNDMKTLVQTERSKENLFDYQYVLKTIQINTTSMNAPIIRTQYFLDFLDEISGVLNNIVNSPFSELKLNLLEYLPANFAQFFETYGQIIEKINSQFYSSNHDIMNNIQIIMIFLIILVFCLKLLEVFFLLSFTNKIVRIINIFLRVNQNEAFNELIFCKEIIQSLKDPSESYLNMLCTDKLITRKAIKLNEDDHNMNVNRNSKSNKKKNTNITRKNIKKFSFHNIKSLSNWPLFNYIALTFLILFSYIFFNYYYASILTEKIDQLIGISIFFENLYTLPTTTIMLNRVIVREKVITNVMYNYPDPEQREVFLYSELQKSIDILYNTSKDIPTYSLDSGILSDNTMHLLIYGDICQALFLENLIQSNQLSLCERTLNKAFTKGLLNTIQELLNTLNADDNSCKPISFADTVARQTQKQQIIDLFKTNTAIDRIMTEYFLNKALMLFNHGIQNYYGGIMLSEMNNLKIVVLATGILLLIVYCFLIYVGHKFLVNLFKNMTMVLNLIPYEKLNNDEQTLFLIKKYWRG